MDQKALEQAVHQEVAFTLGDAIIARIVAERRVRDLEALNAQLSAAASALQSSAKPTNT